MKPKYLAAWDVAEILSIPHAQFIALLRKEREKLPLVLNYKLIRQKTGANFNICLQPFREELEAFYLGKADSEAVLSVALLALQDIQAYNRQRHCTRHIARPVVQEDDTTNGIIDLEKELAACRGQLAAVQAVNASANEDVEAFFEAYPICKLIYDLHLAGKNQTEIRAELKDRGYTSAQTGFITQEDTIARSDDTIKQSVKRSQRSIKT